MTPVEWSFQLITSITPANISIMVRRFIYLQLLYYMACGTKVRERASEMASYFTIEMVLFDRWG